MGQDTLVAQLTQLGLTQNQSLAYLTLLADTGGDGLTGYEVGARSGVPRSAIYTVLRRLEGVGAAFSVGTDPQRFIAADPGQWVARVRQETSVRLDAVAEALQSLPPQSRPEPVWIVRRYDEVMDRIRQMLSGATSSVYLSLWSREIAALMPVLCDVGPRDLHAVIHCPDGSEVPDGFVGWVDSLDLDAGKSAWRHKAIAVVDRHEALIGGTEPDADNDAVWTTNRSLVDAATNHIILDITLLARRAGRSCLDDVAPMLPL